MDLNATVVYSIKARVGDIMSLDIPYERAQYVAIKLLSKNVT